MPGWMRTSGSRRSRLAKTIYVVTYGEYSGYAIDSVYDDEKLAEEAAKCCCGHVEEFELNPALPHQHPEGYNLYDVWVKRDGEITWVHLVEHSEQAMELAGRPSSWSLDPRYCYKERQWIFSLWAEHEQHAAKLAGEFRTRILAENLWNIEIDQTAKDWSISYAAAKERINACLRN